MAPDDLKPGLWITFSAKPAPKIEEGAFWAYAPPPVPCPLAGIPMQIVAVSYPWVVCADVAGHPNRIDVRDVLIFKASPAYVRFTKGHFAEHRTSAPVKEAVGCPNCGGKMRQRCVGGVWESVCGECGR